MTLQSLIKEVENLIEIRKGGSGSGNFGHGGIPGHIGGSTPKGGYSGNAEVNRNSLSERMKRVPQSVSGTLIDRMNNLVKRGLGEKGTDYRTAGELKINKGSKKSRYRVNTMSGSMVSSSKDDLVKASNILHIDLSDKTGE